MKVKHIHSICKFMASPSPKKRSKRTYGGLSEEQRVAERRQRFLDAGLEIFGTIGIRGATVRLLCKEASLTERYFYESFKDSEDLFAAVYETQSVKMQAFLVESIQHLPQQLNPRIHAALDRFFTFMRDEKVVRVLLLESMVGSQTLMEKHHATIKQYFELAADLILADNNEYNLSRDLALHIAAAINGATTSMAAIWMLDNYRSPQEQLVESCALVVTGTIQALRQRK